jgi:hypothetical protein
MFQDTETFEHSDAEPEKRDSGRTGPTSPEGRATSSKNATKHGACSHTLILPGESEDAWLLLLNRWCQTYEPEEDSLKYDFVLKTAQAEWHRIRTQRNYDVYLYILQGVSPFNWTPDQIKKHDLNLRYKTAAERAFQREYRLLEQHYKVHPPAAQEFDPDNPPSVVFTSTDSPCLPGYTVFRESSRPYPTLDDEEEERGPPLNAVHPLS